MSAHYMSVEESAKLLLLPGAVGILPTDTLYGLVARISDKEAVQRLYSIKKRDKKPGTLIAANNNQLEALGIHAALIERAGGFWPGPVSIIFPIDSSLDYLSQGVGSLAIRMPANRDLVALLEKTGPLITSSANHPGKPPATTIAEAQQYFGDQVDFYIDGGNLSNRAASTIIRFDGDHIEIIRLGATQIDTQA